MKALTSTEARDWMMKDSQDSGWSLNGSTLCRSAETASRVEILIPDAARLLTAFTRDVTTALDDYYTWEFQQILLTEWKLGSPVFDQVGWKTCELMRRGYGELRSLEAASAHFFRFDEVIEARAVLMQVFINQWSAIFAPGPVMYFISIDEERLYFHLHDASAAKHVCEKLGRWKPTTA